MAWPGDKVPPGNETGITAEAIVSEACVDAVVTPSCTVTVKVNEPLLEGVPESTPVLPSVRPPGKALAVHV